MKINRALVGAFILGIGLASAQAAVILDNSSLGRYNAGLGTALDTPDPNGPFPCANVACSDLALMFPTAPNLGAASGFLGNWLTDPATPGGSWTAEQVIPLTWTVNTETAIIYAINAGAGLTNLSLSLGVDNGIFVWLDGQYMFGARNAGGAVLWEYLVALPNLDAGIHYLQILREDHGGGTGYAVQLTAERSVVPEPAMLGLLGLGLAGLAALRRRRA